MPTHQRTDGLADMPGSEVEFDADLSPEARVATLWEQWRRAQGGSERALQAWYAASKGQKARAHAAYSAALDVEGHAAEALAAGVGEAA